MANEMPTEICQSCTQQLLWAWGHGITNKKTILQENIELIREELMKSTPDKDDIFFRLAVVEKTIRDYSELPSPFLKERVHLYDLLQNRIKTLKEMGYYKDVNILLEPNYDLFVNVNPIWVRRMIDIIVDNALESMDGNSQKNLTVRLGNNENWVIISFRDNGRGIENSLSLFTKPHTLQPNGRGRGGYVAKIIADIYGGKIEVSETGDRGTEIIVQLPLDN